MLGNLPFADGIVVVPVSARKDVDIVVGIIVLIALAEAVEGTGKDAGCKNHGGKNGCG